VLCIAPNFIVQKLQCNVSYGVQHSFGEILLILITLAAPETNFIYLASLCNRNVWYICNVVI